MSMSTLNRSISHGVIHVALYFYDFCHQALEYSDLNVVPLNEPPQFG